MFLWTEICRACILWMKPFWETNKQIDAREHWCLFYYCSVVIATLDIFLSFICSLFLHLPLALLQQSFSQELLLSIIWQQLCQSIFTNTLCSQKSHSVSSEWNKQKMRESQPGRPACLGWWGGWGKKNKPRRKMAGKKVKWKRMQEKHN